METKENVVGGRTIIMDCGLSYFVVVDAPYESNAPLPIPISDQTTLVGAVVGYQVLGLTRLVILSTKSIQMCNFHVSFLIRDIYNLITWCFLLRGSQKGLRQKNKRK